MPLRTVYVPPLMVCEPPKTGFEPSAETLGPGDRVVLRALRRAYRGLSGLGPSPQGLGDSWGPAETVGAQRRQLGPGDGGCLGGA